VCRPAALSAWIAELESVFPHLSRPQVKVLAEYSLGMVLAGRCGLSCVAFGLARWLGQKFDTVRERIRDWYCGGADKSGRKRRDLDVEGCFGPLLAWVLKDWHGGELAIALDVTVLGRRFAVLAISVVYRSCAIPVAWTVLTATAKGAYKPHWKRLLQRFKGLVPPHLKVIVLADRGLYAKWLFKAIVALGWHPLLRINTHNAEFKPDGGAYQPLDSLLPRSGSCHVAQGTMFRSDEARLACTLLAQWGRGQEEGWFVLTDLAPQQAAVAWYGLRAWIERGFKHVKSGGWNWQDTRMIDPARAGRQWLAMAVAGVLLVRQGTTPEIQVQTPAAAPAEQASRPDQPPPQDQQHQPRPTTPPPAAATAAPPARSPPATTRPPRRVLSVFRKGLLIVQSALLANLPLAPGRFAPEPWPQSTSAFPSAPTSARPP
jgi:hypothetical protein